LRPGSFRSEPAIRPFGQRARLGGAGTSVKAQLAKVSGGRELAEAAAVAVSGASGHTSRVTPEARFAAAISILDAIIAGEPGERALIRWGRASRYAGARDRAAVRDIVFDCLRQRRSLGWIGGGDTGRALVLGYVLAEGADPETCFSGKGYAPARLAPEERSSAGRDLSVAPAAVRLDYPDCIADALCESLGPDLVPVMSAMRMRAPVDLRANPLKADRVKAARLLAQDGVEVAPHPLAPHALRVVANPRLVGQSDAYRQGLVELQDVSSQAAAAFAGAMPGMAVLDYCAGGGGKSLALGAAMRNSGRLIAHDAYPNRMKDLPARARRAGVRVEVVSPERRSALPPCDLVFVDAPCSGTGAWRRNPEGKWRLTKADLPRLAALQDTILAEAAEHVRSEGLLVYATCSLLRAENEGRVTAFLGERPGWRLEGVLRLGPLDGGDGFFAARLRAP
jgi:16S rRNA (cytosine967-C5)-methyltransferase